MGDSIVYEHESIKLNSSERCKSYRLVKFKDQIISVEITYNSFQQFLVITNLDTKTPIIKLKFSLTTKIIKFATRDITAFMYSDSLLWVGLYNSTYKVFVIDLDKTTLNNEFPFFVIERFYNYGVKKITPVGTKCFMLEPNNNSYPTKVFAWSNLLGTLEDNIQPIYILKPETYLYPINWKSSSIEHLSKVQFLKTKANSEKIDLLDGHFNLVVTLNVCGLFPDYQPFTLEQLTNPLNIFSKLLSVNENCLVYVEKIHFNKKNVHKHIYCWDFTTNTQVKFSNSISKFDIDYIVPFRSTNKIKFITFEFIKDYNLYYNYKNKNLYTNDNNFNNTKFPHTHCNVYESE